MFQYQSGRVIALGRAMLALLFLCSVWLDETPATPAAGKTYSLLLVYVVFAVLLAAVTWRNWWLDARLAAPAHACDMAMFTAIVFSSKNYSSPFFLFFILPLLSAAIRWGVRQTMLTATALVVLYSTAGFLLAGEEVFTFQRFIVRTGHLVILSGTLIWFGIHQKIARLSFRVDELDSGLGRNPDPLLQALNLVIDAASAQSGALLLRSADERHYEGITLGAGGGPAAIALPLMREAVPVVLFDVQKDRSLSWRATGRRYRFVAASKLLEADALASLGATQGFVAEVKTGTQEGWLVLWGIANLSVDFLELGAEMGRAAGAVLDHDALLRAIEERTAAGTRLSLARDVHDSLVQFLAGATFRVEAIMRRAQAGGQVESDLKELKRLLIEEQGEMRAFVLALRRDRELELAEAVGELKSLALRLGQQWSVDCRVDSSMDDASIPIRLQLDLQQLLREAVANAVRHGGASRIDIDVGVEHDELRLHVKDNGSGFVPANGTPVEPWSLKERVDRAHGSLSLTSRPGCTDLLITLPLEGAAA